mgnify:CR=1 FL=1
MKLRNSIPVLCSLLLAGTSYAQIPKDYYKNALALSGETLKDSLNNIISGHTEFPYTSSSQMDCWDVLKQADKDPNNANNVIGLYSRFSMDGPLEYNSSKGWSREHVWAKSRGNFGTSRGEGTDLHNLFAEDVSTNSARNNRNFDVGDTRYVDNSGTYVGPTDAYTSSTDWVWEPPDSLKGDVARVIFYMDVRYEGENGELDLEIVERSLSKTDQSPLHSNGKTLYSWHLLDSVSKQERMRNDTIYKYQQNRNPFVDHPEFVQSIYEATFGEIPVGLEEVMKKDTYTIYPNPSADYLIIESDYDAIKKVLITNEVGTVFLERNYNSKTVQLKTTAMAKGLYYIQLTNSVGERSTRVQLIE